MGELAVKEGKKGFKVIKETAKRQGFGPGVDAGRYGGSHGLVFCRKNTPKANWLKHEPTSSPEAITGDVMTELDGEDLTPEMEEALK